MSKVLDELFVNEISQKILDKHKIKTFFSGKNKELGDKFVLAMLIIPHSRDIEIIIDVCKRDIEDETYSLEYVKYSRNGNLGYFRLRNPNDIVNENIKESLKLRDIEEKLDILKSKIDLEIKVKDQPSKRRTIS